LAWVLLPAIAVLALVNYAYREAARDPVVRSVKFGVSDLPVGSGPIRILLMADFHVKEPDMPPARLERIVREANALNPDIAVLAGDFTGDNLILSGSYSDADAIAPLAGLHAKRGVFAVLGNNDQPHAERTASALRGVGIVPLQNEAVQLGLISLGGFRTRYGSTIKRLLAKRGFRILVSHSPDGFSNLPPGIDLMLAGHTHCGQIVLPLVGAIATGSSFGSRYLCGVITDQGRALVVTAGLGTSEIPLRFNAPPDMWLIELEPPAAPRLNK
jgi:predicted MPP superfamily phosphohydrolase